MALSPSGRTLAILLLVFLGGGLLLTPIGFETRSGEVLSNPASIPWLGLAFGGFILIVASLVLLFSRPRTAAAFAVIGPVSLVVLSAADQAGVFVSTPPPLPITVLEILTAAIAAPIILLAYRVYRESRPSPE